MSNDAAQTRGMTLASYALTIALFSRLKMLGVISADDISIIVDGSLSTLEEQPDGNDIRTARLLVEAVGKLASSIPKGSEDS